MATTITLKTNDRTVTVEVPLDDLDYLEFMSMLEVFITSSGYSDHEIQSYILDWAADIESMRNN